MIRLSDHAVERLLKYDIMYGQVLAGVDAAVLVEDYPSYVYGPNVLVLEKDRDGLPIHVVWGLPASGPEFAVVVTAYRPDARWDETFMKRKPK